MHKKQKLFRNTKYAILKYIKQSPILVKSFLSKTKNRKYTIDELYCVLNILKLVFNFRSITYIDNISIHWGTVYKFYVKLVHHNIIKNTFQDTIKKYLCRSKNKIFLTDTTLIPNKMGIDKIGFNPQLLKHKTTKISYITDKSGVPIDVYITSGNHYDSKILTDQINQNKFQDNIITKNNVLLGDAGYDSNNIRKVLKNIGFGKLICSRNKRNIKDPEKLMKLKLSKEDKKILKNRITVEHIFAHLKAFKRISLRYDKYFINYSNFVLLASLMIIIKKTSRNKLY